MNGIAIYHVTTRSTWDQALSTGKYQSDSLQSQGFIHCSEKGQIPAVIERYFAGQKGLVILKITPEKIGAKIVYEGPGEGEKFPHIYGMLPIDAVENVYLLDGITPAPSNPIDWEAGIPSLEVNHKNDLNMIP